MKQLDRLLRRWRCAKALPFIRDGDRLLDIGCFDSEFLDRLAPRLTSATGIDPLATPVRRGNIEILRGTIPGDPVPPLPGAALDCITLLAVLEHIQDKPALARVCARLLSPQGRIIITVPSPAVDRIVYSLVRLHLAAGMSLDEHHGFDPADTPAIFAAAGFVLTHHRRFQLGLNHLFVFEKPA